MLKQRIISLAKDEILIIKTIGIPQELAEVRVLQDSYEDFHVFTSSRPFATLHTNQSDDDMMEILR